MYIIQVKPSPLKCAACLGNCEQSSDALKVFLFAYVEPGLERHQNNTPSATTTAFLGP